MSKKVVVLGCGVAGLSAAVTAAEEGLQVDVLERSRKENRGGNSRYTEAYLRMKNENELSDDFEDALVASSVGTIDPALQKLTTSAYDKWPGILKASAFTDAELISTFSGGVLEGIGWLKRYGVKFLESTCLLLQRHEPWITPSGGGEAVVEALASAAEKNGVHFHYETTGLDLIQGEKGEIKGIHAWSKSDGKRDFPAQAVILASGGYEGNSEMMTRYLGPNAYLTRPICQGGLNNKGEGIEMALRIGAASAGQFDFFHTEHIDPRSGAPEAQVHILNYSILVNQSGKRFLDEGSNLFEFLYDSVGHAIMRQEKGVAYLIFDSKTLEIPNILRRIKSDREPIKATSIKELATKLEIDFAALEKTIKSYNLAVQDGHYNSYDLDGKCTKGIEPPKSNWARVIDENDLICYPVMCGNVFTLGGLKITPNAEVVNRDGWVIPGLYAAGEMTGLFYRSYPMATSFLRGLVFGRKAGKTIAAVLKK
jgi:tricarballylate dehydrogenase